MEKNQMPATKFGHRYNDAWRPDKKQEQKACQSFASELIKKNCPKKPTADNAVKAREPLERMSKPQAQSRRGVNDNKPNWMDELVTNAQPVEQRGAELFSERQLNKTLQSRATMNTMELRHCQQRLQKLKEQECHFGIYLDELKKEQVLLKLSTSLVAEPLNLTAPFQLKKIKDILGDRFEAYQDQLELCINILRRIYSFASNAETLCELLRKCAKQLETECLTYAQVQSMNEAEAKSKLECYESKWREMQLQRCADIEQLIEQEQQNLSSMLAGNKIQQQEVAELCDVYLAAINNSSEQLEQKNLVELPTSQKQPNLNRVNAVNGPVLSTQTVSKAETELQKRKVTFAKPNLGDQQNSLSKRDEAVSTHLNKTRSQNAVTPPKFGRKRVTWD